MRRFMWSFMFILHVRRVQESVVRGKGVLMVVASEFTTNIDSRLPKTYTVEACVYLHSVYNVNVTSFCSLSIAQRRASQK